MVWFAELTTGAKLSAHDERIEVGALHALAIVLRRRVDRPLHAYSVVVQSAQAVECGGIVGRYRGQIAFKSSRRVWFAAAIAIEIHVPESVLSLSNSLCSQFPQNLQEAIHIAGEEHRTALLVSRDDCRIHVAFGNTFVGHLF